MLSRRHGIQVPTRYRGNAVNANVDPCDIETFTGPGAVTRMRPWAAGWSPKASSSICQVKRPAHSFMLTMHGW